MNIVDYVPVLAGKIVGSMILVLYMIDFTMAMYREKKDALPDIPDKVLEWKENLLERFTR